MSRPIKSILLMVIAQAGCLALGLWIHDRYLLSSARWTATVQAWSELDTQVAAALPEISQNHRLTKLPVLGEPLRVSDKTSATARDSANLSGPQPILSGFLTPSSSLAAAPVFEKARVLLVDHDWRLLAAQADANGQQWDLGTIAPWRILQSHSNGSNAVGTHAALHGTLLTAGGPRPAVARKLPNNAGFVLLYQTNLDNRLSAAALDGALSGAGLISFVWICGLQAAVVYLILTKIFAEHSRTQTRSEADTLRRTQDLLRTRDAVIFGLAKLAESRDPETGHHLERISLYSTRLASQLRHHPKFRKIVTPAFIRLIGISSALHDIGKVGTEDSILLKPGALTQDERSRMQQHSSIGGECLMQIERRLAESNFLEMAREIALYHHERWDGSGYPFGLADESIPLAARIVAIADVYDALSVRRVYKDAYPHAECVSLICKQSGKHFDPDIVEAFVALQSQFAEIARQFAEADEAASEPRQLELARNPHRPEISARELKELLSVGQSAAPAELQASGI